jgi:hypothetical protein
MPVLKGFRILLDAYKISLRSRLNKEGNETVTDCNGLKLVLCFFRNVISEWESGIAVIFDVLCISSEMCIVLT